MSSSNNKRIVVTGVGAVTPVGIGKNAYWNALASGTSGVGRITLFDPSGFDVKIAGEVKNFDPSSFMDRKDAKRADRFTQFAVAAAREAVEDSGLVIDGVNAERVGVLIGSGIGGLATLEEQIRILIEKGPNRVSPFLIPMMIVNMASGMVSILTGAKGPNSTVATACATGAHAIGDSLEIIRRGDADVMIVGGAEAAVTPVSMAGFGNMKAMASKFNDCPEKASRPFDAGREGFVIGEGAGILVIETLESAEKRGAKQIYAELVGYGMSGDAYHMSAPAPEGEGVARAIRACLRNANLEPDQVDYVNAHATSTPIGDPSEVGALRSVFGERFKSIPVSATKSMTGHLLGGAGGIEAIATVLALQKELLPPTINYETPDPECEVDCVPNVARKARLDVALSNNFGFGGHNAVVAFKRF
ncbi:MAG: beta-ketoacyl-ACP synthase II [Akkermansiaceae bacterium]|nr:beta-ketoacyl-ACP synthase II [Armatimonadota bacterium]